MSNVAFAVVLGETTSQGSLADLAYCQSYADSYGIPRSHFYVDTSGQQAHDVLFSHLYYYPDDQGYLYFPWEAVLDTNMEYVFSSGVSPGDAETAISNLP